MNAWHSESAEPSPSRLTINQKTEQPIENANSTAANKDLILLCGQLISRCVNWLRVHGAESNFFQCVF